MILSRFFHAPVLPFRIRVVEVVMRGRVITLLLAGALLLLMSFNAMAGKLLLWLER